MFIRLILAMVIILASSSNGQAKTMLKFATEEQVEKLCVTVILKSDLDKHHFYYKNVVSLDDDGLKVKFGRRLEKTNHIPKESILNFDEAKQKLERLKAEMP